MRTDKVNGSVPVAKAEGATLVPAAPLNGGEADNENSSGDSTYSDEIVSCRDSVGRDVYSDGGDHEREGDKESGGATLAVVGELVDQVRRIPEELAVDRLSGTGHYDSDESAMMCRNKAVASGPSRGGGSGRGGSRNSREGEDDGDDEPLDPN